MRVRIPPPAPANASGASLRARPGSPLATASRTRIRGAAVLALAAMLAAGAAGCRSAERRGPPTEVITGDFGRAEVVVEVVVTGLDPDRVFNTDEGVAGYVDYVASARVVRSFKGAVVAGDEIDYRFTVERDPDSPLSLEPGRSYIVFLKREPSTGRLWLVAEAAQLEARRGLVRRLERLVDR